MVANLPRIASEKPLSSSRRLARFILQWLRKLIGYNARNASHFRPLPVADTDDNNFRQMTFTFAVIALSARLAGIDGKITKEEYTAFCKLFPMPREESAKIHQLFLLAHKDVTDVSHYIRQIVELFPGRQSMLEELMMRLCRLAACDGRINSLEMKMLESIAEQLGVSKKITGRFLPEVPKYSSDPYIILGISPRLSNAAIKKAYRDRIREVHPDRVMGQGQDSHAVASAAADLARINSAYQQVAKKRKIK